MTKLLGFAFIASTALLITACDGGEGDFSGAAAELEGIYKISSYTRNEAACAPGGSSVLGNDRFAIAYTEEVLARPVLMLSSCASVDDCRAKLELIRTKQSFGSEFHFDATAVDGEALVARGASSGILKDGIPRLHAKHMPSS